MRNANATEAVRIERETSAKVVSIDWIWKVVLPSAHFGHDVIRANQISLIVIQISISDKLFCMCFSLVPKLWTDNVESISHRARVSHPSDEVELSACYRLRYDYFVVQKQWIEQRSNDLQSECDDFDPYCHHLGVFEGAKLLGYLRALPWSEEHGFMLEHDFRCLLCDKELAGIYRTHSLEISRLVLAPGLSPDTTLRVTELLFKLLYQFSRQNEVEHLYAVIEPAWLRRFQRCFHLPFQAMGKTYRFPDGTRAVAAHACISDLEESLQTIAPLKMRWYQEQ